MSQSTDVQIEEAMTKKEAIHFAEIIETRKNLENFYKGEWLCRDYPCHSEVIQRNHHEPHENCTGHLLITRIEEGKLVYIRAIARLIARSPSMLQVLKKALPIIEAEADLRDAIPGAPFSEREGYWVEMRELANEISAEIDKAYGLEIPESEFCRHGFGLIKYCPDCKPLPEHDPDEYDYAADDRNFDAAREKRGGRR